jgi:hypothetical protein
MSIPLINWTATTQDAAARPSVAASAAAVAPVLALVMAVQWKSALRSSVG